ncbi:hypothetical protein [Spiroplasma endosymbiont of Virgichneumon dumeticola]|uniref:hypothetical protein n=1 Tax=Spiroplasma endosymbiont of Virgichneumon dumeticola TaxID=3139323 RepID=UPI0035C891DF
MNSFNFIVSSTSTCGEKSVKKLALTTVFSTGCWVSFMDFSELSGCAWSFFNFFTFKFPFF